MLAAQMRELTVGDRVQAPLQHVRRPGRRGEIVEIVREPGHERCRVRWDDGDETFVYPGTAVTAERSLESEAVVI